MSIGISELLGIEKMTVDQADFSKTLTISPIEKVSYFSKHTRRQYVYPVICQLYAYGGSILGVSVKLFDCESPNDDGNGQFFTLLNTFPTGIKINLKKRTHYSPHEYKMMFGVISLLEHNGYNLMFKRLVDPKAGDKPAVQKLVLSEGFQPQITDISTMASLEDFIS